MIQGQLGSKGELFFELDLIAANSLSVSVNVMLDTGFTGFLAMNQQDLTELDWSLVDREILRTARGERLYIR